MTLVRAKDLARDDIEQEKIEQQINTTKDFVKALACGTPESEAREARLTEDYQAALGRNSKNTIFSKTLRNKVDKAIRDKAIKFLRR